MAAAAMDAVVATGVYSVTAPYEAEEQSSAAKVAKMPENLPSLLGKSFEKAQASWSSRNSHQAVVQRGDTWLQVTTQMHNGKIIATEADVSDMVADRDRRDTRFRRVCHDLRTPLHGIVGLAEDLMFKAKRAGSDPRSAEAIMHEGQRLSFMINDILDSSKLKAGKMELNLVTVSAHNQIEKVVMSLRQARDLSSGNALLADDVTLRNDIDPGLPAIDADAHRLSQILFNLVGNACKFTKSGSIKVHGEAVDADSRQFLAIHVEDTGAGIPPETLPHLFQEFIQADNSESREFAGTGLGLSICRELVELHGGDISVVSRLGQGSKFTFTMPVSTKQEPESDAVGNQDDSPWEMGDGTLDELFGASGAFGTGNFRYGTGGLASGRYDRLTSILKRLSKTKTKEQRKKTIKKGDMWLMTEAEMTTYMMDNFRWFVGTMDRTEAAQLLDPFPAGSFLVRQGSKGFVFSVRYKRAGSEQEMLFNVEIYSVKEPDDSGRIRNKYFIAKSTRFDDLPTLVDYYQRNPAMFFGNLESGAEYKGEQLLAPFSVAEEMVLPSLS